MAVRRILTYPDPVLARAAAPVENITSTLAQLADDMAETMYVAPGIGLAAPQVGVGDRVVVLDVPADEESGRSGTGLLKLVNPVIAERDGEITWEEACLSVPDLTAPVTRSQRILLRAWTTDEKELELEAEDLVAVAIQHELDHLDGVLFLEHLSRLKRDLYRKRRMKQRRQGRTGSSQGAGPHLI
jgi:peptide deformylase